MKTEARPGIWAHPRSRGENTDAIYDGAVTVGSSPLTRGKLGHPAHAHRPPGLIPAHAGKTSSLSWYHLSQRAHPRSRGENQPTTTRRRQTTGLIPAHAGKTPQTPTERTPRPAHPRSRGENSRVSPCREFLTGSSPLTRGKPVSRRVMTSPRGLIPAHAGKTRNSLRRALRSEAHPRSRGENTQAPPPAHARLGSSPLTRGKHARPRVRVFDLGLIPAHAGKTLIAPAAKDSTVAHPRSRGENRLAVRLASELGGSSPLTRGKLRYALEAVGWAGLIPAHAGKTAGSRPRC